jgi:hypothetical protein
VFFGIQGVKYSAPKVCVFVTSIFPEAGIIPGFLNVLLSALVFCVKTNQTGLPEKIQKWGPYSINSQYIYLKKFEKFVQSFVEYVVIKGLMKGQLYISARGGSPYASLAFAYFKR